MTLTLKRRRPWYYVRIVLSVFVALLMFFPIYWLIISSFKSINDLFGGNVLLPSANPTAEFYVEVLGNARFWGFVLNSTIVGITSTTLVILLSVLGAYSLARFSFPGSQELANTVLFIYMVPPVLLAIPIYIWMYNLGLLNSRVGVIFAHVARGLPFALWMLRGFFANLPRQLEDAARIDGCTWLGVIWRVILPLSGPGVVAVATYTLILSWNDYVMAFMLLTEGRMQTLPVGLIALFEGGDTLEWGQIMAGSILSAVPVMVFFFLVQKLMVRGLTAGAVKG